MDLVCRAHQVVEDGVSAELLVKGCRAVGACKNVFGGPYFETQSSTMSGLRDTRCYVVSLQLGQASCRSIQDGVSPPRI